MKVKKLWLVSLLILTGIVFLPGCAKYSEHGNLQNVGMLTEKPIQEEAWERKAYHGLLEISEAFDVEVYLKEEIQTEYEVAKAVDEFVQKGVNLIFGHSHLYGKYFMDIAELYPDVHFVYFNGKSYADNVTSLNFNPYAMAFFGGMVAGEMTSSNHVGIIAAYEWQAEIEGFYEGVKYQNARAKVHINYLNRNDKQKVMEIYDEMKEDAVDVYYPAGDTFSRDVIHQASKDKLYAIGYLTDQSEVDPKTVLTSTVEQIDELYQRIAEKYNERGLQGEVLSLDFQDGLIVLGEFSADVPQQFQRTMRKAIEDYKEQDILPLNNGK